DATRPRNSFDPRSWTRAAQSAVARPPEKMRRRPVDESESYPCRPIHGEPMDANPHVAVCADIDDRFDRRTNGTLVDVRRHCSEKMFNQSCQTASEGGTNGDARPNS